MIALNEMLYFEYAETSKVPVFIDVSVNCSSKWNEPEHAQINVEHQIHQKDVSSLDITKGAHSQTLRTVIFSRSDIEKSKSDTNWSEFRVVKELEFWEEYLEDHDATVL